MRVLAAIALGAVALAFFVVQYRVYRHWLPQIGRPTEGWLWQRSRRQQVLGWGGLVVGLGVAVILIIKFPPGSAAEPYVRLGLLMVMVGGALMMKRRNRRDGVKAAQPFMEYGPPGWQWDPDRVTWRPPK
jgi:hypothetical protein